MKTGDGLLIVEVGAGAYRDLRNQETCAKILRNARL
jgi:hypothetical protein